MLAHAILNAPCSAVATLQKAVPYFVHIKPLKRASVGLHTDHKAEIRIVETFDSSQHSMHLVLTMNVHLQTLECSVRIPFSALHSVLVNTNVL